ncbi:MAG: minor capsid protein [Oscillospiraceae bacterium]|nr:minor capsid protein [Oscillospiraceae bacterium]
MSSRDYWKRRSLQLEQLIYSRANETVARISRLYDQAQREMVEQIEGVFNTFSRKGALTQAQAMSLLSVKETEEARTELLEQYQTATGDVKQDLWARLAAPAYANRISRLQALRDRLYAQARMVGLEEVSLVRDRLEDALCQSYYRTVYDTQREAGAYYDFNLLSDNQIKAALAANWSGKNWSERIWDNNQAFANAVQDTVTLGLMTGQRYDEIRDNLLYTIGMDSTAGARYRAARLVRTECNYIANQGHLMGYRAAGLEQYIFLATLDLRTSEICRSLDGRRFDLAQAQAGTNLPPMHPNCRSTTIPADAAQLLSKIKRAARNPVTGKTVQVPGDMTYREWYEQYVSGDERALANEKRIQQGKGVEKRPESDKIGAKAERDIANQKTSSLRRAIRKYEKQIEEHQDKIDNPEKHYPEWSTFDSRYQDGLKRHWGKEIQNFKKNIQNRRDELRRRSEDDEKPD